MTPEEFKENREKLGLSVSELATRLNTTSRSVRRWEDGSRPPNPTACRCLEWFLAGFNPDELTLYNTSEGGSENDAKHKQQPNKRRTQDGA